jgi:hypothetical protein
MKSYKQFISESVNISGDFNGNLYINSSQSEPQQVGEGYIADVLWNGSLYRMELTSKTGIPSKQSLGEQLQTEYPGAIVHQIYPVEEKNLNIKNARRYHPSKLEWID